MPSQVFNPTQGKAPTLFFLEAETTDISAAVPMKNAVKVRFPTQFHAGAEIDYGFAVDGVFRDSVKNDFRSTLATEYVLIGTFLQTHEIRN